MHGGQSGHGVHDVHLFETWIAPRYHTQHGTLCAKRANPIVQGTDVRLRYLRRRAVARQDRSNGIETDAELAQRAHELETSDGLAPVKPISLGRGARRG